MSVMTRVVRGLAVGALTLPHRVLRRLRTRCRTAHSSECCAHSQEHREDRDDDRHQQPFGAVVLMLSHCYSILQGQHGAAQGASGCSTRRFAWHAQRRRSIEPFSTHLDVRCYVSTRRKILKEPYKIAADAVERLCAVLCPEQ
jgi:hypothetical protein